MQITKLSNHGRSRNRPKRIVIHAMGEFIGGIHAVDFLQNVELSAHVLGASNGDTFRLRNDIETAYHALGYNRDTLGYEFLVPGDHTYATFLKAINSPYLYGEQYQAGVDQVKEWMELWGITDVVRHSDISPERKVDPGDGFPWELFKKDIGL